MKQALLILFVGIYFQLSCSDYKPNVKPLNDLDRMELKGDVRSLTVAIYKAVEKPEGIIKEEFVSKFNYLFNEYGYMTESVYFKSDSGQDAKTTCKYDEKGKIIEKVTTNNADDLLSKTTLKYDEKGNLIKQSKYHVPSTGIADLRTTTDFEYDNMRNPYQSFKQLMTPGKYTNPNNITKEIYTIHFEVDQWTQKVQITNNSYEYNNKDYPIKVNGEAEYVYR